MDAIARQTLVAELEVIVVSDGHDDATSAIFADGTTWPMPVQFVEIPKSQQGTARNRGVEKATAPIVLFTQDDIFLLPDACEKHLEAHRNDKSAEGTLSLQRSQLATHHCAVVGFTEWDPEIERTPVMDWLDRTGWQFGYDMMASYANGIVPPQMQHRFTYTSNLSVPRDVAVRLPFREDVTLYGWEDMEWGLRLRDAGIPLIYAPGARALHHHPLSLSDSLRRMEKIGASAKVFARMHPDFDRLPRGWKLWAYRIIALLPTMRGRHAAALLRGMRSVSGGQRTPPEFPAAYS